MREVLRLWLWNASPWEVGAADRQEKTILVTHHVDALTWIFQELTELNSLSRCLVNSPSIICYVHVVVTSFSNDR